MGYGPELINIYPFMNGLSTLKKVLFVTTSNRSPYVEKQGEVAKSSQLARHLKDLLEQRGVEVELIDAAKLNIHNCLGCVSELHGNPLYEAEAVIFFSSQRWGTANAIYQKLIERLDWIENMHSSMGEPSTIKGKKAGFVLIGQNWRVKQAVDMQREVLEFYGFEVPPELFMGWQFTRDVLDESEKSYKEAPERFEQSWNMHLYIPELKEGVSNTSYRGMQIKNFGDFLQSLS